VGVQKGITCFKLVASNFQPSKGEGDLEETPMDVNSRVPITTLDGKYYD